MPVPTEAATQERVPASPSEGTPADPAETVSGGEESVGATSPVDSLNGTQSAELEENGGDEKPS